MTTIPNLKTSTIGVLGLGYVGLPLAVEFGKKISTVGFDINTHRIAELERHHDATLEVDSQALKCASKLSFTAELDALRACNIFIVTVPTPIDAARRPNLAPLMSASRTIGQVIKPGDLVIYESTVYPGATEDDCIPIIEQESGLTYNKDFFAGYSPERINPGDKLHRLPDIKKVTSGSTPAIADLVDELYQLVITAGTHKAPSLRVAEAAKVIENTQRDLNIALINELALIFERMGLDTHDVLAAAGTKWNFLPFKPGLVGGHCIGVDPYYLTYKAQEYGYHPEVILAGRRINDNMGSHIAHRVVKLMTQQGISAVDAKVLVLGFAFKENCPDLRNTRVIDVINELQSYHLDVEICDPWVDGAEASEEYGVSINAKPSHASYDAIVLCVAHDEFVAMGGAGIRALAADKHVLYDVKGILDKELVTQRL